MTGMYEELRIFDKYEWKRLVDELALSPQQSGIVRHLFFGRSDKQIAMEMGLSVSTVRTHFGRLFAKYNVQDRTELILLIVHHFRSDCRKHGCPRQQLRQDCLIAQNENSNHNK